MDRPSWVLDLRPSEPEAASLLELERAQSNISVEALSTFLYAHEGLQMQQRILPLLENEPLFDRSQDHYKGRIDAYKQSLARAKRLRQLEVQHSWTRKEKRFAMDMIGEVGPYNMHYSMFTMTIQDHGTPKQHRLFLDDALNYKIIGCYAQTELGHGSNVRALETTATWISNDKTFMLHSPHLTAAKWWIGGLGLTANHVVLMAQLIVDGKSHGPHLFVLQIRDMKTHLPLPGVYVGDIGPKAGLNSLDNGFLVLNNVKIPHVNMLARFSYVDPVTGSFFRTRKPHAVYSTMTYSRCTIVFEAGRTLARGATIALRYMAGRRQSNHRDTVATDKEIAVLNYSTVQLRLFPVLAWCFALHCAGSQMMKLHAVATSDLHPISCGLKALASTVTAEGIEICRRALGGHGFSSFSGLVSWYGDYLPTVTWEGDNYVVPQQTAMYLIKCARSVKQGDPPRSETCKLLASVPSQLPSPLDVTSEDNDIVDAFARRTVQQTFKAEGRMDHDGAPWNEIIIDFGRLSTAFSQYLVIKWFHQALQKLEQEPDVNGTTQETLRALYRLLSWRLIDEAAVEFILCEAVTTQQVEFLRNEGTLALLKRIRPHAVGLVDAWNLPDYELNSSLGRRDGRVYEDLFYQSSVPNPLNSLVADPDPNSPILVTAKEKRPQSSKL